ncbi:adenine phosphoribosyltransferase [Alphaproteobacteria bacterium]|nr:adenine phosphoribosyltransferase [Alphaproteobacteria bacterium]
MDLKNHIQEVKDFPKKGIIFRDISPLLSNPQAMNEMIEKMAKLASNFQFDSILAIESRGFIIGAPLAYRLKKPLVLARKSGKLPPPVVSQEYGLEYGNDQLQIKENILPQNSRILIVDDVLATGGTIIACQKLLKKIDCHSVGAIVLIEIKGLNGQENLQKNNLKCCELLKII